MDWRGHFARKIAPMRKHGAITGAALSVTPYTPDSYADDVLMQIMLKMREAVADEVYEECGGDGLRFRQIIGDREDLTKLVQGEHGHYIETAYQEILAAHPLGEP